MSKPQILLTNDDGIRSPGLWAAAESLAHIGYITVVAPREQSSGMGRSLPLTSDGIITEKRVQINGQEWTVYAVGGSPAQAVLHGFLEVMPHFPDLVVSGINYGENIASGITISGTVGAALEAASNGIPALAISLQTASHHHLSYSTEVDFSSAAHFTSIFGQMLLGGKVPSEVRALKVDVPSDATRETPWELARLSLQRYYRPVAPKRTSWSTSANIAYEEAINLDAEPGNTDAFVLLRKRHVAVVPLELDLTAKVDFSALERALRK